MIVCGIIFILFNDASLQPWNKPQGEVLEGEKELKQMEANNNDIDSEKSKPN